MRTIKVKMHTGYPSMDSYEIVTIMDDDDADELAWEMALSHAESYGVYPYPDDLEEGEDESQYSWNIEGSWEYVDDDV